MNLYSNPAWIFERVVDLPAFAWEPAAERAFALDAQAWKRAFGNEVAPARALLPALLELHARLTGAQETVSLSNVALWISELQRARGGASIASIVALALRPDLDCSRACVATIVGMTCWKPEEFDAFVGGFLRIAADAGAIAWRSTAPSDPKT